VTVPQGSYALDCFNFAEVPDHPEPVSAGIWIESWNVHEDSSIWEHSKGLPSYRSVLTLLWIKERIEKLTDYDEDELLEELHPLQTTHKLSGHSKNASGLVTGQSVVNFPHESAQPTEPQTRPGTPSAGST